MVRHRFELGSTNRRVLNEERAGQFKQAVLLLTEKHSGHLRAKPVRAVVGLQKRLECLRPFGGTEELLV